MPPFGMSAIKTVYDVPDYLASGMAAITERKRELTASDDLKIAATSA